MLWCKNRVSTGGNDKWRGYGKDTCQEEKSDKDGYVYPMFHQYLGSTDNYANAAFQQVELDFTNKRIYIDGVLQAGDSITHTLEDGDTITRGVSSDKPEASELVNYANWFAYYRTRIARREVGDVARVHRSDRQVPRRLPHAVERARRRTFLTARRLHGRRRQPARTWYGKLLGVIDPDGQRDASAQRRRPDRRVVQVDVRHASRS